MHRNIQISDKFDTQLFFIGAEDPFIGSATSAKAVKIQRFDSFDQSVEKHSAPVHATSVLIFAMIAARFGKKDPYDIDQ